jgi:hypothetical protein
MENYLLVATIPDTGPSIRVLRDRNIRDLLDMSPSKQSFCKDYHLPMCCSIIIYGATSFLFSLTRRQICQKPREKQAQILVERRERNETGEDIPSVSAMANKAMTRPGARPGVESNPDRVHAESDAALASAEDPPLLSPGNCNCSPINPGAPQRRLINQITVRSIARSISGVSLFLAFARAT